MASGHSVKLAAPIGFKTLVERSGIAFVPLAGDPTGLSRHLNGLGNNSLRMVCELINHAIELGPMFYKKPREHVAMLI